jgi:hypothetical protein
MAPMGMPPPITLPYVPMSALMPNSPCAPLGCMRKPVITSSKISAAPCCLGYRTHFAQKVHRAEFHAAALHGFHQAPLRLHGSARLMISRLSGVP